MQHDTAAAGDQVPGGEVAKPETVAQCHEVIALLVQQVAELRPQNALLLERLQLSSRNSSKPPSSDGPAAGNRAQRRASARKRGAQKGHPGSYRAMLPEQQVSEVVECAPRALCECGAAVVVQGQPRRHQLFELPAIQAQVTEYRLQAGRCAGCGRLHRAALPAGVPAGQLGPRALALIGMLGMRYHLSQHKVRDLLAQLLGIDFSIGAISQAHGKVAAALKAPVQHAAALAGAPVVNVDETSWRYAGAAAGSTHMDWVWARVTPKVAVFNVIPSRARYVLHSLIGERPKALVGSDRYAAYDYIDPAQRQVCWAHLLRDFRRIAERAGQPGRIGARLLGLGYLLFRWRDAGRRTAQDFEPLQRRLRQALQRGAEQQLCRRTARTCANVLKLWPALWGFIEHPGVEPTNNSAEQALRALVLKRKRSARGVLHRGGAIRT
ncbi:IS66 family transposase, partial [uncultured Azohydromonas sp.]|uniref:IS66 family transposase n=1 Tax=uncultured Azohydromonas sp. TaxID=487342 RepID=UPI00262486A5